MHTKKKCHLESGLNQRDEGAHEFFCHTSPRGPEIKNLDRGCGAAPPPLSSPAPPRSATKKGTPVFFLFVCFVGLLAQTMPAQPAGGTSPSVGLLVCHMGRTTAGASSVF